MVASVSPEKYNSVKWTSNWQLVLALYISEETSVLRGLSCAWRSLTCWNYFPVGLKNQTLIGLLQHKLADIKRVRGATVSRAIKCRHASWTICDKSKTPDCHRACQAFARSPPPKRIQAPNNYNPFQTSIVFNSGRPVHESVISIRWMSAGGM